MVGQEDFATNAKDTQAANKAHATNHGNVIVILAGVDCFATKISIIAPITDLAETEQHATILDKENILALVNQGGKDKIVKFGSQMNASINPVLMVELVR